MSQLLHQHIDGLLSNLSASIYLKDKDGCYLDINSKFLEVAAVNSQNELSGATDMDLHWYRYAPLMISNDQAIIQSESPSSFVEPSITHTGMKTQYFSHKTPLRNRLGKIIGIFGLSYDIENEPWNAAQLNEINMFLGINVADTVRQFSRKNLQKTFGLTNRQIECITYLLKGLTARQIAEKLSLSHRTVEHYLEALKLKFDCYSKAELITKLYESGF